MNARARMILAVVAALIVCALFFFLAIRGRQAELDTVRADIEAAENQAIQLNAELNRLKALQERAPELQAELTRIRELVPIEHEVPNYIFLVQDAATEAGVDFISITPELPRTPPEAAPLAQVRMEITAEGGYFALQDFMRRLYALDRATRIDTLNLAAEEATETEASAITMTIAARIFFELPAPPETDTQADPNVAPPTAPVASPGGAEAPTDTTTP